MKLIWSLLKGLIILALIMIACVILWVIFEEFPMVGIGILLACIAGAFIYVGWIIIENLYKLFKDWWHDKPPGMA